MINIFFDLQWTLTFHSIFLRPAFEAFRGKLYLDSTASRCLSEAEGFLNVVSGDGWLTRSLFTDKENNNDTININNNLTVYCFRTKSAERIISDRAADVDI